jgi:hypothetical protein
VNTKSLGTIWFPIYLFVIGLVVAGLLYGRKTALRVYGDQEAQEGWDEWVKDVANEQPRAGPVARRTPKSAGPPALILMRDYFAVCLGGSLLVTTAVYWSLAFLLHGALTTSWQLDRRGEQRQ